MMMTLRRNLDGDFFSRRRVYFVLVAKSAGGATMGQGMIGGDQVSGGDT
jgi:hypothetical protein